MNVDLDEHEKEFLIELLSGEHADLKHEIYRTEGFDFKEDLRRRKLVAEALLRKLGSPRHTPVTAHATT
jgi:hypothetical protein